MFFNMAIKFQQSTLEKITFSLLNSQGKSFQKRINPISRAGRVLAGLLCQSDTMKVRNRSWAAIPIHSISSNWNIKSSFKTNLSNLSHHKTKAWKWLPLSSHLLMMTIASTLFKNIQKGRSSISPASSKTPEKMHLIPTQAVGAAINHTRQVEFHNNSHKM